MNIAALVFLTIFFVVTCIFNISKIITSTKMELRTINFIALAINFAGFCSVMVLWT